MGAEAYSCTPHKPPADRRRACEKSPLRDEYSGVAEPEKARSELNVIKEYQITLLVRK